MAAQSLPNLDAVENRREQLRRWIATHFNGNASAFIASTADGQRQLNQGELSGLLRKKSFGEKRARSLEIQAHMPPGYLDRRAESPLIASEPPAPWGAPAWPFASVTPAQFEMLDDTQRAHIEQTILLLLGEQRDTLKKSTGDSRG